MLAYSTRVIQDLVAVCVPLGRDIPSLFQQWYVDVRFDITLHTWVSVPIPRPAEVAALLDDPEVCNALLGQIGTGTQAAEPSSENRDFDILDHGVANEGLSVSVDILYLQHIGQPLKLTQRLALESPVAFLCETLAGSVGVEVDVNGCT